MKKITLLILLTSFSFVGFSQTTIASYTFDTDTEAWLSAGATPVYDAANYYTATGSVIMVADNNKLISSPKLDITTGTYTFTLRVKGTVGASIRTQFKEFDNASLATNGDTFVIPATGGDGGGDSGTWFELTQTKEITVAGEVAFRIQNKSGSAETFYIDDVTIVKADVSGNTLFVNTSGSGNVALTLDKISYDPADIETLTATASTHWNFDGWSGDLTGSVNPETLLMDADKTVTANFAVDPTFDYDFLFNADGDQEGWTVEPGITISSHTGGVVTLLPEFDKFARFSLDGFPVPSANKFMQITMQNQSAGNNALRVIIGAENIEMPISVSDTGLVAYEFDLSALTTWIGDVSSIRIRIADLATGKSADAGLFIIDQIVFNSIALSTNDIDYIDDASLTLYPNPVNDVLNISTPLVIEKVEIFNLLGQKTMSATTARINTADLAKGMYVIKVTQENDVISTKRFIKQ